MPCRSKVCRSRYSTAVPSYESFCLSALRKVKCLPGDDDGAIDLLLAGVLLDWLAEVRLHVEREELASSSAREQTSKCQSVGGSLAPCCLARNGVVRCCALEVTA